MLEYLGLWVLLAMTLNMWALLSVVASPARWRTKGIWAVGLLLLPGLGFLVWFLVGPRGARG
ncbi:MAG: PLDc N-terminal domain-containing protein [Silicimonas sp.]|jgi:hypothetical protein|nr:PLDc N-terminal domain-containing protein [Silicimonas sp.]